MRLRHIVGALVVLAAAVTPVRALAHMNDEQSPFRAYLTTGPLISGSTVPLTVSVVKRDGTPAAGLRVQVEVYRGFSRTVVALPETTPGAYQAQASFRPGRHQGVVRLEGGEANMFGDLTFQVVEAGAAGIQQLRAAKLELRQGGFTVAPPWVDQVTWVGLIALLVLAALSLKWRVPRPVQPRSPVLLSAWVLGLAIAGAIAGPLGAYWDIAWHVDRGRETFWSPPHLVIYGAITSVLVTISLGVLALSPGNRWQAFSRHPGLRFTVVATIVGLASAPFDEFWHLTFGLDTSIWSPPHLVLLFGFSLSILGLTLLAHDRLGDREGWAPRLPVLFLFGTVLTLLLIFVNEFEWPLIEDWNVLQDRPVGLYPFWYSVLSSLVLAAGARASRKPGSATIIAAFGWGLRMLVSVAWLPALGSPAPLLPPFLVAMGVVIDLVTRVLKERAGTGVPYAVGGLLATGLAFALHVPTASLIPIRPLPGAELVTWLPLALLAALAAGYVGSRLGGLVVRSAALSKEAA